jgi:plasmid stabilization system protein ParE
VRIGDAAREEIRHSASYYDNLTPGVGDRFLAELNDLLAQVDLFPNAGLLIRQGLRQRVFPTFPYLLLYTTDSSDPEVVAVAHTSRLAEYWIERWDVREPGAAYVLQRAA